MKTLVIVPVFKAKKLLLNKLMNIYKCILLINKNKTIRFFQKQPPCTVWLTAVLMLADMLSVGNCRWRLDFSPWTWLLSTGMSPPTSSSSSPRSRLGTPSISRRPSSWPRGAGDWSPGVRGSQGHVLLQVNSSCCCTRLYFGRLGAFINYDIWESKKSCEKSRVQIGWWHVHKERELCVPGGGSSSTGGGIRDLLGSRSFRSFITSLVLSLLFLRFFSSSRA